MIRNALFSESKIVFKGHQIAVLFYAYGNKGKLYIDGSVVDTSELVSGKNVAALRGQLKIEEQTHVVEVYAMNQFLGFWPTIKIHVDGKCVK